MERAMQRMWIPNERLHLFYDRFTLFLRVVLNEGFYSTFTIQFIVCLALTSEYPGCAAVYTCATRHWQTIMVDFHGEIQRTFIYLYVSVLQHISEGGSLYILGSIRWYAADTLEVTHTLGA